MQFTIVYIVNTLFQILQLLIFARIILSFIPFNPYQSSALNQVREVIWQMTEPIMEPFRRIIPPASMGGGYMDFSPIIVLILLRILRGVIIGIL